MSKWFAQKNNKITGPFDQTHIESMIQTQEEGLLIWGKSLSEWITAKEWLDYIKGTQTENSPSNQKNANWYFKTTNITSPALSFQNLIVEIRKLNTYDDLLINNDEKNKWISVFAFPLVADELGITRRQMIRVPILGFLNGQRVDDHSAVKAKVVTISQGGCGITEGVGITSGTSMKGIIKSPNLPGDVHFSADVVYIGKDGYVGMKFTSISPESQSQIIEYVNKFKDN
jgi:hypothetical protein